jgi:hypothetical protein
VNPNEFHLFLDSSAVLCAVMIVFNLLRQKKRGLSAILMSIAFLFAGISFYLLRRDAPQQVVIGTGTLTFLVLVADLIVRSRDAEIKRRGE